MGAYTFSILLLGGTIVFFTLYMLAATTKGSFVRKQLSSQQQHIVSLAMENEKAVLDVAKAIADNPQAMNILYDAIKREQARRKAER